MKLLAIETAAGRRTVVQGDDDELIPPPANLGLPPAFAPPAENADLPAFEDAVIAPPLRPGKVIVIGLNYRDHAAEAGLDLPSEPVILAKFPSSLIGHREPISFDSALTSSVDWEVELAFVVGSRARRVSEEAASGHVFGYAVANDVTARDLQFERDSQWVRAKSLDSFCPLGPAVVTADEVSDPQALALRCRVNGEVVQESSTSQMIFSVASLVSFLSRSFTLEPGDVVLTGTPWGVGYFMDPRRSLRSGDLLESEIDGIGRLVNPVVETVDGRVV
ncbi:MAG TPA: fumarylacetoacetate hydrolase family protein [Solirubrobacterales bacterium]|nr:fumarylacetoacetate hydrolase family protein [Solirubrobacterales bacterium]